MVFPFLSHLRNLWPFKFDDLRSSNDLVRKLTIPERTRQFVFAVREQESQAVIYLLAAQNLSEQSVVDAETLIREVRPDAVVAHVSPSSAAYVQSEDTQLDSSDYIVPTSFFQVLRRCFRDKFTKEKYEHVAGSLVMQEIFGTSFLGHFSAARNAAGDVGATFLWLQSPFLSSFEDLPSDERTKRSQINFMHLGFQLPNYESSQRMGFSTSSDYKGLIHTHGDHVHTIRSLCSYLELSISSLNSSSPVSNPESKDILPQINYEAPPFAQPIYPLLLDLRNIFDDIPSIEKALYHAQKLLSDVSSGQKVDIKILREVYAFRIAVEGLRMVLNNAARVPASKFNSTEASFSDLSDEHKSHALLAQALRGETKNFKTIVAIVDANILAGIRRQWNTPVPTEVRDMAGGLVTSSVNFNEEQLSFIIDEKQLIKNQVVAVGAGATAALGVSSISKLIPSSTIMKVVTFKLPVPFKLVLIHGKKAVGVAFGKFSGSSAALSYGSKTTSALRTAAMAEKMRLAAHSVIAYAERTSLSAMRASFYEIMRKRQAHAPGLFPLFAFGCSFSACAGLVMYREGIECVAESLVDAPSIACLGRGIQNLHKASVSVKQSQGERLHRSIELLMLKLKKVKIQ